MLNLLPMLPCPALQTFADAGLGDVGAAVQHEHVIAPPDWARRYGLRHGAAFGLAHGLDQLSLFRCLGGRLGEARRGAEELGGWVADPAAHPQRPLPCPTVPHLLAPAPTARPADKDKRLAGLYFVGASTRPGNGVPLCFIGAKLTVERVLKDLRAA